MGGAQQPMGTGSYFMPAMQVPPNNFMPRPAMIRGVTPRWGSSPQVSYINQTNSVHKNQFRWEWLRSGPLLEQ